MASSVWSTVQGTVVPSSLTSVVTTSSASSNTDPTALLHHQLASALSTVGDAQFWEETISPSTIRTSLASSDPSNPNSTPTLLRGMKWLLASISKGRDVSDFYPHVVKLVGASSLEVRKMVYVYLVQYADHDSTTRELSLLSINSFQRGLADTEPWIRALALRVLTSIRIPDILQIQILGVQTCAKDRSPYVRKCAANALAKLYSRCDSSAQRDMLLEIMIQLLEEDTATMVLTSAIIAFSELCPERLVLLHNPYRKICHLLTDMDEWGQVVVLDLMARYCRKFFKKPQAWKDGSAEQIDRDRRVRRTITGIASVEDSIMISSSNNNNNDINSNAGTSNLLTNGGSAPTPKSPKKIKRRVIKKGFYSDEEDESTEEEVDTRPPLSAFRQPNVLQPGIGHQGMPALATNNVGDEDLDVDEDHRLLLRSSLPLLKSRNAAVVMAVCSLHYYCGVSSVKIRSAMGKALVRIHRDRREIQYVVLTSIRTLVQQCPSAFGPFLNDFFVKAMDPPFTRIIKLEILTALALEPVAIEGVLKELRSYVRSSDKMFVCAAIRAVGKVVELSRIVYDRHGAKHGQVVQQRKEANRIALDCLFGLNTLTQASDYIDVIGECAMVMQRIILQLMSDASVAPVEDPNGVLGSALRRIILLLTRSLSSRSATAAADVEPSSEDAEEKVPTALEQVVLPLGPVATASLLWIFGEWVAPIRSSSPVLRVANMSDKTKSKIKLEVLRLVAHSYPELQAFEKEQGIHLASKMLVAAAVNKNDGDLKLVRCCELLLSMGRVDVNPIVRDRARYESLLLDSTVGLKHDREGLEGATAPPKNKGHSLTMDDLNRMLLASKPAPSHLPLDDDDGDDATIGGETTTTHFRFGTLSSLVGHKAGAAYLALPPWADKNSPASLRDGSSVTKSSAANTTKGTKASGDDWQVDPSKKADGFYESSEEDDSNDGDEEEEDSDESEDDSDDSDDEEDDSDDEDSDEDESDSDEDQKKKSSANNGSLLLPMAAPTFSNHPGTNGTSSFSAAPKAAAPVVAKTIVDSDDDDDSSSSSDDDSSDDEESSDDARPPKPAASTTKEGNLLGMLGPATPSVNSFMPASTAPKASSSAAATKYTSVAEDLSGLVMAPLDLRVPNLEQDSSAWIQLVRPSVSGGLDLQVRFLRGPTKEQEARRLGLNPEHAGTVCLQVRLENIKSDSTVLRRIRLLQKSSANSSSSSSSSTVLPRKVVLPNEVVSLAPQQVVVELMGLEFVTVPDRDGSCLVKLELKHGSSGGIPIDWKIPLAELLRRNTMTQSLVTVATFDAGMQRLQGFQRVSTTISLPTNNTDEEQRREQILRAVLSHAALVPVAATTNASASAVSSTTSQNHYWSLNNNQLRLVASLPGSGDPVFVSVTLTPPSVQLTVCCDNALALNSLVDVLKRAILQSSSSDKK